LNRPETEIVKHNRKIRFVTLDARRLAPAFRGNIPSHLFQEAAQLTVLLKLVKCAQAYCVLHIVFYSYWTSILQGADKITGRCVAGTAPQTCVARAVLQTTHEPCPSTEYTITGPRSTRLRLEYCNQ
jgi:hypothetical protein